MADIAHNGYGAASGHGHESAHEHPGERLYIKVAAFLLTITVLEVVVYYIQWTHDHHVIGPILLIMSAVKFITVVGFFMHLKFDDNRLALLFGGALILSGVTVVVLRLLLQHHGIEYTTGGMITK